MRRSEFRVLVVGAGGYIGKSLFDAAGAHFDVVGTSSSGRQGMMELKLERADCFDYQAVRRGDTVLLTAAISAPDVCASRQDYTRAVNVVGTSEFVSRVIERGARVVFFSSDTVYGEREDGFGERTACTPAGEYAVMKHEVEQHFAGNPSFKAVRLSYVFSRDDKFTKYLAGCAQRNEEAELFHPFSRAIVHRDDVVDGALALAQRWDEFPQQVINFGGPEVLSRIDFVECLKRYALPGLRFRVTEPGDEFFKNRPRVIAMSSEILPNLLARPARTLAEAVRIEFGQS